MGESCTTPSEAKAKHRATPEELLAARRTIRWWEPAGRVVTSKVLSPEAFNDLQATIMQSCLMDPEVASRMQRKPDVFMCEMLPSLALQTASGTTMAAEARLVTEPLVSAAKARFEVFLLDYHKDISTMNNSPWEVTASAATSLGRLRSTGAGRPRQEALWCRSTWLKRGNSPWCSRPTLCTVQR